MPNLTSRSVINYCVLPSRVSPHLVAAGDRISDPHFTQSPSYSQVGVSSFFVQDAVSYIPYLYIGIEKGFLCL